MVDPRKSLLPRGISTALTLLMLSLSVAVPVLERGTLIDQPVAENQHAPGECPSAHDHTVCTQVGANLAIDAAVDSRPLDAWTESHGVVAESREVPSAADRGSKQSRAPPQV